METCLQSRKAGRSWHKWGLVSFYSNLIQYHKGQSHGMRWHSKICSGIFLIVKLTIEVKNNRIDTSL